MRKVCSLDNDPSNADQLESLKKRIDTLDSNCRYCKPTRIDLCQRSRVATPFAVHPSSVRVQVMGIRHVGMRVVQWGVLVCMAVRPHWHHCVGVRMMPIFMRVGVFMLQRLMIVCVAVRFQQVQHDTNQHQNAANQKHPCATAAAHGKRTQRTHEWRQSENRACAPRTKRALGQ